MRWVLRRLRSSLRPVTPGRMGRELRGVDRNGAIVCPRVLDPKWDTIEGCRLAIEQKASFIQIKGSFPKSHGGFSVPIYRKKAQNTDEPGLPYQLLSQSCGHVILIQSFGFLTAIKFFHSVGETVCEIHAMECFENS